jgi:hypothetical protein
VVTTFEAMKLKKLQGWDPCHGNLLKGVTKPKQVAHFSLNLLNF